MLCFIPDTNILLNAVKGSYDEESFLSVLQTLVINQKITLTIPEQVVDEFNRNVDEVVKSTKISLQNAVQRAEKFESYVLPKSKISYGEFVSKLKSELEDMEGYHVDRKVKALELLIQRNATIIPTKEEYKVKAAEWALNKMAPFFGARNNTETTKDNSRRNSIGDAVIFLSVVDHVSNNQYDKAYFITENYTDFSKAGKKHEIHENLVSQMPNNLSYEINLAKVLHEIVQKTGYKFYTYEDSLALLSKFNEAARKIELRIAYPNDTVECPQCHTKLAERDGYWNPSIYGGGLSWWRQCYQCGLKWDTGDYWD